MNFTVENNEVVIRFSVVDNDDIGLEAAELSQAWAESPTAPGDLGTKSAKTHSGEAGTSATNASNSAGESAGSATSASTSANNAATSESNAAGSATLATEQAVLSAAARDDAETARLGAENAEDGAVAAASAAEVAKIEWRGDWVAGTYQMSDAVAYLGSSWIANKETAETPSLAAVDWDLMAEKGDDGDTLPVGAENDLIQYNGAGVAEAKSTTLVNQSLTPFYNSVLGSEIDLNNVFFWDNFRRANTANGVISTSDSGIDWVNINGVPGVTRIQDNTLLLQGTGQIWGINIAGGRDVEISGLINVLFGNIYEHSYLIGRDSNNYYRFRFNPFTFELIECLAGTETVLLSLTGNNVGPNYGNFLRLFDARVQTMKFRIGTGAAGNEHIGGYVDQIGSFRIASIAANYASILPNGRADIKFIGIGKFSTGISRQNSIIATYISV